MKAKFGDYFVAAISFNKRNPMHRYIIHVDGVDDNGNIVCFTPFILGEHISHRVCTMNQFLLINKIHI